MAPARKVPRIRKPPSSSVNIASTIETSEKPTLLTLPPEIRNHIFWYAINEIRPAPVYSLLSNLFDSREDDCHPTRVYWDPSNSGLVLRAGSARVCRQLRQEILTLYYGMNTFVIALDDNIGPSPGKLRESMSTTTQGTIDYIRDISFLVSVGEDPPESFDGNALFEDLFRGEIHLTVDSAGIISTSYKGAFDIGCTCTINRLLQEAESSEIGGTFRRLMSFTTPWVQRQGYRYSMKWVKKNCQACRKPVIRFIKYRNLSERTGP